ncbi:hypothetical protein BJI69_14340 [Luteibacter rhizovicinus DSM 16549]|uniref:Uncharacterized protein n=1 Tax=Luteibacter rhizovicinus DSM 16549 TaxID=1440763 RepID=A0A0G9HG29_9GAMM|nr:DUF3168 domain-containing protein [Luteibacter rhizovicinus]APG04955.1 hypothetical protein BJI69_14340 [Luteibacter rhizovicinus DSM 16549]KLD68451.1 hypothetical protein Y883_01815 [Luteibacter rhizovicinus DSM 16549]KLD76749.1 hypothetical protein Y886_19480 [Xanthomonas hyacinthi DSM 19077]
MSLEESLFALLGPLVAGRCTPDVTDDNPVYPLIVYQGAGGQAIDYADQTPADKDNARVQVWVWCLTRLEASALSRQVRDVLLASNLTVKTLGAAVPDTNAVLKLYGARTDFSIWYPRT